MAANVFGNVFRRGRDVARVVLRRQAPPVNKTDNVRQPAIYTALVRCQTPVVPSRIGLFIRTNVSIYKTLASQLRRRVAFEYGRPNGRTIQFLGFVGVALSTSNQDQDDSLSGKIRDVVQKRINIPITQQLSLDSLDLGNVIGQGCNSDWFDGQLQQLQREITTLINASDFVENPRLPQIVPLFNKEEESEDKWFTKENSQREITDDLSNCKLSTTSCCEESFVAINEDRDVVQKIDNSPTIQRLHPEFLDLDKCNQLDDFEKEVTSLENASDFVANPSLPQIVPVITEEESEDKWFPPTEENSQREITNDSLSSGSCKLSTTSSCGESFIVIDEDRESNFCILDTDENSVSMSFSLCSSDSESMMSVDSDTSREYDLWSMTSFEDEDDKWSVMDELDYPGSLDNTSGTDYNFAVKMMFNYEVESKADSIIKAMEKETVPARVPVYQHGDSWLTGNRVRLKSLPQHPNIVDMVGAFVNPLTVPQMSVAMEKYPAALPKRLFSDGLGRNMTMFIVMKRYGMTLREYLEDKKPNIRIRCLLLAQLLEGIVHLCQHGISHRDIKSDNLFLEIPSEDNAVPRLVIGDFGCCLADKEYGLKLPYFIGDTDRGGNCSLMAPEIATATPGRNVWLDYTKADLWAVGTLIYELFGLDNPFYTNQSAGALDSRTYNERDLPPLLGAVPEIVKCLSKSMLSRDPKKRISPVDAANIMQMYLWCPADWFVYKPNVKEVKGHLLVLTAQVVLQGGHDLCPEHQLMATFLQRLNLNDIIRILDSFAEVDE